MVVFLKTKGSFTGRIHLSQSSMAFTSKVLLLELFFHLAYDICDHTRTFKPVEGGMQAFGALILVMLGLAST